MAGERDIEVKGLRELDAALAVHPAAVELSVLPVTGADLPFFLLGESMGGAVSIACAASGRFPFAGVMLIAPMCGIDPVGALSV